MPIPSGTADAPLGGAQGDRLYWRTDPNAEAIRDSGELWGYPANFRDPDRPIAQAWTQPLRPLPGHTIVEFVTRVTPTAEWAPRPRFGSSGYAEWGPEAQGVRLTTAPDGRPRVVVPVTVTRIVRDGRVEWP